VLRIRVKKEDKRLAAVERKVSVIDESVFEPDYDESYDSDDYSQSTSRASKSCEVVLETSASRVDSVAESDSSSATSKSKHLDDPDRTRSKHKKQKSKHKKEKKEKKHKKHKTKKKNKDQ